MTFSFIKDNWKTLPIWMAPPTYMAALIVGIILLTTEFYGVSKPESVALGIFFTIVLFVFAFYIIIAWMPRWDNKED